MLKGIYKYIFKTKISNIASIASIIADNIASNIDDSATLLTILSALWLIIQQYCWSAIWLAILLTILLATLSSRLPIQKYCWQYCQQFCWLFSNIAGNIVSNIDNNIEPGPTFFRTLTEHCPTLLCGLYHQRFKMLPSCSCAIAQIV